MAEIILVIGANGFLGQHLISLLLDERKASNIVELRTLDLLPYRNKIGHETNSILRSFVGDICQPDTLNDAFKGVNTVFHCAALVSLEHPEHKDLKRVNIDGTKHVLEACIQHNIERLIFTSCASVCMVPFKGSTFSIIINQTESKCTVPNYDAQQVQKFEQSFLIPHYAATKLRAENIVTNANGTLLSNKKAYLSTVAIRPPLCYGECDENFIPSVYKYLAAHNFVYPRIAGSGGKQQVAYAGNVAWGHVCAYKTLKSSPAKIAGLPVFVTDDTPINDISRFVQKQALLGGKFKVNLSRWYVPHFLFFFIAYVLEMLLQVFGKQLNYRLPVSWRALATFTSSVLMFNRMRAEISMNYVPRFEPQVAMERSAKWYAEWYEQNLSKNTTKKSC